MWNMISPCALFLCLERGGGGGGEGGAWEGGMASKTLIYSISRSLVFCLWFIHVHNYPKLTDNYIFVTD